MLIHEGVEITGVVKDNVNFAECFLVLSNIKQHRSGIYDVRTIEDTNTMRVIANRQHSDNVKGILNDYGEVDDTEKKIIIIVEDEDLEVTDNNTFQEAINMLDADLDSGILSDIYIVGDFNNQ